MEDIKWFIKKFGIIFVILLVMIVSVGIFFEKNVRKSSAEETWEKPVQISDIEFWQEESDYERENEDNSPYWIIPQSKSLLSEEESKNIQNEALTAAELVKVVYKDIVIIDDVPAYASGIDGFTNEQGEQVIKILGKSGYVCVKENIEMQNYNRNLLGGLYRENPVKSRNYEAVKSSKKWENVGISYIIPALLLYRYSYI